MALHAIDLTLVEDFLVELEVQSTLFRARMLVQRPELTDDQISITTRFAMGMLLNEFLRGQSEEKIQSIMSTIHEAVDAAPWDAIQARFTGLVDGLINGTSGSIGVANEREAPVRERLRSMRSRPVRRRHH